MTPKKTDYTCIRDEQIQGQSRKIAELEAHNQFKDQQINELNETMKDVKKSVDSLDKTINEYILKSVQDDNALREYVNLLENRVTSLESTQQTLKWLIGAFFSAGTILTFICNFVL